MFETVPFSCEADNTICVLICIFIGLCNFGLGAIMTLIEFVLTKLKDEMKLQEKDFYHKVHKLNNFPTLKSFSAFKALNNFKRNKLNWKT